MLAGMGRGLALAGVGVAGGLVVTAALIGTGDLPQRTRAILAPETSQSAAELPKAKDAPPGTGDTAAIDPQPKLPAPQEEPKGSAIEPEAKADENVPSLDIVRVEPTGETVIAGRAAPNATIELLRDDKPFATAKTDATGQFAIVPPPLPTGNSALTLRSQGKDGKAVPGRESVAVVVDKNKTDKPLIAVSDPDKPTRVLSQPGPVEPPAVVGAPPAKTAKAEPGPVKPPVVESGPKAKAAQSEPAPAKPPATEAPVKVVSVDAQDGGRLYVSGQAAAGASLRLYLNDTLVASGRAGNDGRIGFTIGRGVRAGAYQVRIDQVDPASGKVGTRAQVAFAFPEQLAARVPEARTAPEATGAPPPAPVAPPTERRAAVDARPPQAEQPPPAERRAAVDAKPPQAEKPPQVERPPQAERPPQPEQPPTGMAAKVPALPVAKAQAGTGAPADEPGSVFVAEISTAKIIRGDSLWQISHRTYGDGRRYTVIYDANQQQIRDPDLIYPGQIFVLPKDQQEKLPASARRG